MWMQYQVGDHVFGVAIGDRALNPPLPIDPSHHSAIKDVHQHGRSCINLYCVTLRYVRITERSRDTRKGSIRLPNVAHSVTE